MSDADLSRGGGFTPAARAFTILINYLPFLHAAACATTFALVPGTAAAFVSTCALLYLIPPLLFRAIALRRFEGRVPVGSGAFLRWWAGHQTQILFCRFPVFEELLRLVPGAYSCWLRLWGARIGARTYWTAGVTITDRAYLDIGDNVTFGAGVRLNAHVVARNETGAMELILATVAVGDGALVGGYSLLTAGTSVAAGSVTRAFLISPPFSRWENDRRRRDADVA